jgi:hypothetical protein
MPTTDIETNDLLAVALVDIQKAGRRAATVKHLETARELADNGYPCMETLAKAMMAKFAEVDEILDELLSNEGSVLQPELAAQIFAVLELAKKVCVGLPNNPDAVILLAAVVALEPQIAEVAVEVDADDAAEVEGDDAEGVEADADDVAEVA